MPRALTIFASLVLSLAAHGASGQGAQSTSPRFAQLQVQLTGLAVQVAKENFGVTLDFSHQSVRDVERILGQLHEDYKRTKKEEGLRGLAAEFAAYIITVIERNTEKGVWEADDRRVGPGTLPFHWRGTTIFPYGWCLKRIYDGDADNVWVKYEAFVLKAAK